MSFPSSQIGLNKKNHRVHHVVRMNFGHSNLAAMRRFACHCFLHDVGGPIVNPVKLLAKQEIASISCFKQAPKHAKTQDM